MNAVCVGVAYGMQLQLFWKKKNVIVVVVAPVTMTRTTRTTTKATTQESRRNSKGYSTTATILYNWLALWTMIPKATYTSIYFKERELPQLGRELVRYYGSRCCSRQLSMNPYFSHNDNKNQISSCYCPL